MIKKLHIDIETYSSVDLRTSGLYKYMESVDFEILMVAYAFGHGEIQIIDLAQGEKLPPEFISALTDPNYEKNAHNAAFERNAFRAYGFDVSIDQWKCTAIKAAYCGLPLSLDMVSKALHMDDLGKSATGKNLIKFFCLPIRPTKINEMRVRNFYFDDLDKWEEFKLYCIQDVRAEREIDRILKPYPMPKFETDLYIVDQKINDRGVLMDLDFARNAFNIDTKFSKDLKDHVKQLTGLENPNSPLQLKKWLSDHLQKEVTTLAKDGIDGLIEDAGPGLVSDVLKARKKLSKTSTKKYLAMENCAGYDKRGRGLFQFYGANRTGRWAGRLVQLQNLPQNHLSDLDDARNMISRGDYELVTMVYDNIPNILSQLIRTAFIAGKGNTFAVADFSSIEARVLSWLADETWRLDVFKGHGKIYEASAAMMFGVPIESIDKGSPLRQRGKTAELALGYQGAIGAMVQMGGEKMGLHELEMKDIVTKWRLANPKIVKMWAGLESCAKRAVKTKKKIISPYRGMEFDYDGTALTIKLPSGKKLFYWDPKFKLNQYGNESLAYRGVDQNTKRWIHIDTYGGKITENVVQAIARDLLAYSMLKLDRGNYDMVMHIHDEIVCEVPEEGANETLKTLCKIMSEEVPWAEDLPLGADGYVTPYYKKD